MFCIEFKQFVTFSPKRITDKHTRNNSSIKFCPMRRQGWCIGKTTKNFEMGVSRRFMHKKLKRSLILKKRTRQPIFDIDSCENAFTPKFIREMRLEPNCSGYIQKMLVFSLNYWILLWSISTRSLVYNAFGIEEINHVKFNTIITPNRLDFNMELSFNHIKERNEQRPSVTFGVHR